MSSHNLVNLAADFNSALEKSPEDAAHFLVQKTREMQKFLGGGKAPAFATVVNNVIAYNPQADIFGTRENYDYARIKAKLRTRKSRQDDPSCQAYQAYMIAAKELGFKI